MLQQFLTHSLYGLYSKDLLLNKRTQPRQGKIDAGDHTPITPLQSLELTPLNLKMIYNARFMI